MFTNARNIYAYIYKYIHTYEIRTIDGSIHEKKYIKECEYIYIFILANVYISLYSGLVSIKYTHTHTRSPCDRTVDT